MIEVYINGCVENERLRSTVKGCVVSFLLNYCQIPDAHIFHIDSTEALPCVLELASSEFISTLPVEVLPCQLPCLVSNHRLLMHSGLCSVLRKIAKHARTSKGLNKDEELLGHKDICLKACAEVSVWTKFCEVEFPGMVTSFLTDGWCQEQANIIRKLESHFNSPPVIPNINKHKKRAKQTGCSLDHVFAEGIFFTLTDIILFVCFSFIANSFSEQLESLNCPKVLEWYRRISQRPRIQVAADACGLIIPVLPSAEVSPPGTACHSSLSLKDAEKSKVKISSKEATVALSKINESNILCIDHPLKDKLRLAWSDLPAALNPSEGQVPLSRTERKCEQLENLASSIIDIASLGDVIVDFCAGGGHLGILVAYFLPHCQVRLVENKEESIERALSRIEMLGLKNIKLYQTNLDYFHGDFSIGTCLHACGVATDLVLNACIEKKANFVICPCCYGGIQNTHTVQYPRASNSDFMYEEYRYLCRCADQPNKSNDCQGKKCMEIIDSDRSSYAQEHGYDVTLCTLDPPTCSPKNNLLIGRYSGMS